MGIPFRVWMLAPSPWRISNSKNADSCEDRQPQPHTFAHPCRVMWRAKKIERVLTVRRRRTWAPDSGVECRSIPPALFSWRYAVESSMMSPHAQPLIIRRSRGRGLRPEFDIAQSSALSRSKESCVESGFRVSNLGNMVLSRKVPFEMDPRDHSKVPYHEECGLTEHHAFPS